VNCRAHDVTLVVRQILVFDFERGDEAGEARRFRVPVT
jgi:hypothetical protein